MYYELSPQRQAMSDFKEGYFLNPHPAGTKAHRKYEKTRKALLKGVAKELHSLSFRGNKYDGLY